MICKFCGKEIEEGSPICNHCAKPVVNEYRKFVKEDYVAPNYDEYHIENDRVSENTSSNKDDEKNPASKKFLYVLSIALMVIAAVLTRFADNYFFSFIGMLILAAGLILFFRVKPVKKVKDRVLTPEEIAQIELKWQEVKEEKKKKSVKYGKISLICNGISTALLLYCEYLVWNYLESLMPGHSFYDIPDYCYIIAAIVAFPAIILLAVGIVCGVVSEELYAKNVIAKVSCIISTILAIFQSYAIMILIMLYIGTWFSSICIG